MAAHMAQDDDPVVTRAVLVNRPVLETMGIAELRAYISELGGEIARAEAAIARKGDHRGAAEAVFRRV